MNMPMVSIIIPVYNAGKYVEQTIQSALNQTWPNTEIIVIDDGSTDESLKVIRSFGDERVKIFTQKNAGASVARNYGIEQSSGKYIQFLDADDMLSPDKIAAQMALIGHSDDYLGLCGTIHFQDGTDHLSYPLEPEWVSEGTDNPADFLIKLYSGKIFGPQYGGMIQPNAWLTPKALINKGGLWNEMRNPDDDGEFFCRMVLASKGILYSDIGINYYRKFTSVNSLSAQKHFEACNAILQSTLLKTKHLLAATTDERAKPAMARLFWENTFTFYPYHKSLYKQAQDMARSLAPAFKFKPYHHGFKKKLAGLLGWKAVRYIQFINAKLR